VSLKCKVAALRVKNEQENQKAKKSLKALQNLDPEKLDRVTTVIDLYQEILFELENNPEWYPDDDVAEGLVERAQLELQQKLTALSTHQAAKAFLELNQACFKEIENNTTDCKKIEEKYLSKTVEFVKQALNHVISSRWDPEDVRAVIVHKAAWYGNLELVQTFLSTGNISTHHRGWAFSSAFERNHLEIVQALLESGAIYTYEIDAAVTTAAREGHLEMLKLIDPEMVFSKKAISLAFREAAENGHLHILKYLLSKWTCSDEIRQSVVKYAASRGHVDVVRFFLMEMPVF
jgi:hypothetical protein